MMLLYKFATIIIVYLFRPTTSQFYSNEGTHYNDLFDFNQLGFSASSPFGNIGMYDSFAGGARDFDNYNNNGGGPLYGGPLYGLGRMGGMGGVGGGGFYRRLPEVMLIRLPEVARARPPEMVFMPRVSKVVKQNPPEKPVLSEDVKLTWFEETKPSLPEKVKPNLREELNSSQAVQEKDARQEGFADDKTVEKETDIPKNQHVGSETHDGALSRVRLP